MPMEPASMEVDPVVPTEDLTTPAPSVLGKRQAEEALAETEMDMETETEPDERQQPKSKKKRKNPSTKVRLKPPRLALLSDLVTLSQLPLREEGAPA